MGAPGSRSLPLTRSPRRAAGPADAPSVPRWALNYATERQRRLSSAQRGSERLREKLERLVQQDDGGASEQARLLHLLLQKEALRAERLQQSDLLEMQTGEPPRGVGLAAAAGARRLSRPAARGRQAAHPNLPQPPSRRAGVARCKELAAELDAELEAVLAMVQQRPQLLAAPPAAAAARLQHLARALDLRASQVLAMAQQLPDLLTHSQVTLTKHIRRTSQLFASKGLPFQAMVLLRPDLLLQKPRSLAAKLEQLPQVLGLPAPRVRQLLARHPQLLRRSPASLARRVQNLEALLKVPPGFVSELVRLARLRLRLLMPPHLPPPLLFRPSPCRPCRTWPCLRPGWQRGRAADLSARCRPQVARHPEVLCWSSATISAKFESLVARWASPPPPGRSATEPALWSRRLPEADCRPPAARSLRRRGPLARAGTACLRTTWWTWCWWSRSCSPRPRWSRRRSAGGPPCSRRGGAPPLPRRPRPAGPPTRCSS